MAGEGDTGALRFGSQVCQSESRLLHSKGTTCELSGSFGEGVVEDEGVSAVGDVDGHLAGEAGQLTCT